MRGLSQLKTFGIGLWLLTFLVTCVIADDTPDSLVAEGKYALFVDGDVATAVTKFDAAITLDASHKDAHFWRAVTAIFDTSDLIDEFEGLVTLSNQDTAVIFGNHTISEIDAALEDMSYVYVDTYNAQQQVTGTGSDPIAVNDYTGWVKHGIRVRADSSFSTDRIALNSKLLGTATGNVTVKLCASTTDTNYPDESTVFASKTIPCSDVPTSFSWVDFQFDTSVTLTELTVYWIVVEVDYPQSSPGYIQVNTTFNPSGNWTYSNGTTWAPHGSFPYEAYYKIFSVTGDADQYTETFQVDGTGDVITLDYADAAAIYAKLMYVKMLVYIGNAYNVTSPTVQQIIDMGKFDLDDFLTTYANAFTKISSASTHLANAKEALLSMINAYLDQSDFIRNTRTDDDGLNHFIRFYNPYVEASYRSYEEWQQYKKEKLWDEQDKRQLLTDIKTNLRNSTAATAVSMAFPDNEGDPDLYIKYQWDISAFFDNAPNIDQYMDEFIADGSFVQGNYSDVSINGMFVNMTVADWNHLKGNASKFTDTAVEWDNDVPVSASLDWNTVSTYAGTFLSYKLYRSTSPDVNDTSTLVATITDRDNDTYDDDTISEADGVYYYRLYTVYNMNSMEVSTYSDTERIFINAYIDVSNNDDPDQMGTKEHPYSSFTVPIEEKMNIGARVRVAEGRYYGTTDSTYIFYQGLHIYGGYESSTWSRDVEAHETIIDGSGLDSAIHIYAAVTGVTIDGLTVEGGSGCDNGIVMISGSSALYITGDNYINNCTVRDITSAGIVVWKADTVLIEDCEVDNCGNYAIQVYYSDTVIADGCTVKNCGYGVYVYYSSAVIIMNSTIESNISNGIYVHYGSSNVYLKECTIQENGAHGIFLYNGNSSVYINQCTIKENASMGVYMHGNSSSSTIYVNQCIIQENASSGVYINSSKATVANSLVSNNGDEGITCWSNSDVLVLNNTIVENTGVGGLGYISALTSLEIYNNIFAYNNNGAWGTGIYGTTTGDAIVIAHNNSYGHTVSDYYECGTEADNDGNISVDPLFVAADSIINPIYRLSYGSPCIDVADNDSYILVTNDLDDSERFVNGTIDMGAYEYYDTDNDGLPNQWEIDNSLDPDVNDADGDADNDGQSNMSEYLSGSDPQVWNADPPEVSNISISELGGEMPLSFTLTDVQADLCDIEVQYKQDGGVYVDATVIGDVTDVTSNREVNLIWDSSADLPDALGEYYYIQVRAKDASGAGDWQEYGPLWILNKKEITIEPALFKQYTLPSDDVQIALKLTNISDADIDLSPMVIFAGTSQYQGTVTGVPFTLDAGKRETNLISVTAPSSVGSYYVDIYLLEDGTDHLKGVHEGNHMLIVASADSDNDGMPDVWENFVELDNGADDSQLDIDSDGLTAEEEFSYGTHPANSDFDNDGQSDGAEDVAHTNPLDPESLFQLVPSGGGYELGEDGIIDQLSWTFEPAVSYQIYWSPVVSGGSWYVVSYSNWQNDIQDNGDGTKTWTYNNQDMILNAYGVFFKVVVDE